METDLQHSVKPRSACRVIFLGTPAFAVASLQALVEAGYQVVAVVTAPDRPAGRGMKLQASAVKQYALAHQLPVLQPEKLKDEAFLQQLKSLHADVQVVVAFRMLPEAVWNMPPMGTVNVHASLLPDYRGAAPINWCLINGETYTGVTTFRLQHAIDTGPVLLQSRIPVEETDRADTLHDKLMQEGAQLLLRTLDGLRTHSLQEHPQDPEYAMHPAPKLTHETCHIDWQQPVLPVHYRIRGLAPQPAAFTYWKDKRIKILRAHPSPEALHHKAGALWTDDKHFIRFACADGYLEIDELQVEGKSVMKTTDFLRGNRLEM